VKTALNLTNLLSPDEKTTYDPGNTKKIAMGHGK
jgi:hypothetical protein